MNPACELTPVTSLTNAIRELSRGQTKALGAVLHLGRYATLAERLSFATKPHYLP